MMPRKVANSGTEKTLLSSVVSAVPIPIPKSATPTGRPMARTDPNATIRMTMAKPRPRSSDDGSSNSAKMKPPSSMLEPVDLGAVLEDLVADPLGVGELDVVGQLDVGEGDLPGERTLRRDLLPALLGVGALDPHDVVERGDLVEERLHRVADLGVLDPLLGLEDDRADDAGALATEVLVEDVESRLRLDVGEVELVAEAVADGAGDHVDEQEAGDPEDRGRACGGRGTKGRVVRTQGKPPGGARVRDSLLTETQTGGRKSSASG